MRQQVARALSPSKCQSGTRARAPSNEKGSSALGADDLGRRDAVQLGFQLGRRAFGDAEVAAGQVQPGQAARGARALPPMKTEASARSALAGSSASSVSVLA